MIDKSFAIEAKDAKKAGRRGFMARALVNASLPYKDPKSPIFGRRNGDYVAAHDRRQRVAQANPTLLRRQMCHSAFDASINSAPASMPAKKFRRMSLNSTFSGET